MVLTKLAAHFRQGRAQLPTRPSPWGLAWLLPLFVFLAGVRLSESLLVRSGVYLLAGVAVYVLYVHLWERRPVRELKGGTIAAGQFGIGFGVGMLIIVVLIGVTLTVGFYQLIGVTDWQEFTLTLGGVLFLVAYPVVEELMFRGVILRYAELWLGSWLALGLSSLLFAAIHFPQTPVGFAERAAMGLACGAAYVLTRRLWMSIGLHLGLNTGVVFAFGHEGVTPITLLAWGPDSPWPYLVRPTLWLVLAGVFLMLAHRKGRLAKGAEAWALQCGSDAQATSPSSEHPV